MTVIVSRAGRIATLAFLISVIAFVGYQFPADETFARLRSWYPIRDSISPAPAPAPAPAPKSEIPSRPRVAVCLVGAARAFELTGKTLKKYVLSKDTDVFLHSPLDKDSHKFTILSGASGLARARIFHPKPLPESWLQREILTGANSPNGIQGLLQYFNLVEGCLSMIHEHEKEHNVSYDWIVRTRVDGYWSGPLPPVESFISSVYYIPDGSHYGGLNDRLGIGDPATSKVALSRLSLLPFLHKHGGRNLNSETAFKAQLQFSKVVYHVSRFPFCILTYRKYAWPPEYFGVPVMSLSTSGALNGAKCRPCTPKATGNGAQNILSKLGKGWGYPGRIEGAELCDARGDWEPHWPEVYEKHSGEQVDKNVTTRSVADCIRDLEEFQKQWQSWDAPSPMEICSVPRKPA